MCKALNEAANKVILRRFIDVLQWLYIMYMVPSGLYGTIKYTFGKGLHTKITTRTT